MKFLIIKLKRLIFYKKIKEEELRKRNEEIIRMMEEDEDW